MYEVDQVKMFRYASCRNKETELRYFIKSRANVKSISPVAALCGPSSIRLNLILKDIMIHITLTYAMLFQHVFELFACKCAALIMDNLYLSHLCRP